MPSVKAGHWETGKAGKVPMKKPHEPEDLPKQKGPPVIPVLGIRGILVCRKKAVKSIGS